MNNDQSQFFGHPKGLFILFLTEMWERFSYYGMRVLLVLYMTKYLLLDPTRAESVLGYLGFKSLLVSIFGEMSIQAMSSQIYGLYTGFVYFTPFFGGMIADKVFGLKKTIYIGGILMAIGHFLMAIESMFLVALLFLIVGNGAFKPNISTQVGTLYPEGDPRRDSAFTIFYMGINLGALFSPLICGTLGQLYGWHYGFSAAGVGMILGLLIYHFGRKHLPSEKVLKNSIEKNEKRPLTAEEWKYVTALIFLCVLNIVFWIVYEQQGNTLQLWADQNTDWNVFGFEIPSTWFQLFNPLFIIIFAPLLDIFWNFQSKKDKEPTSVVKMGIGCFLCGGAYLVMMFAASKLGATEKGPLVWPLMTVWLFTMGELYLSPIGLSLVTKLAPKPILSMMMGVWFLSSFFGNNLAGWLGTFYEKMSKESFFMMLACIGIATGIIFLLFKNFLGKIIGKKV